MKEHSDTIAVTASNDEELPGMASSSGPDEDEEQVENEIPDEVKTMLAGM